MIRILLTLNQLLDRMQCLFFLLTTTLPLLLVLLLLSGNIKSDTTTASIIPGYEDVNKEIQFESPTVFIAILIRNKAHTLPYFLTLLEGLDYPKHRISLWIRSDHNEDETPQILQQWTKRIELQQIYHSISIQVVDSPPFKQLDQGDHPCKWTPMRFRHLIRLKEEAIRVAKGIWADYIWFLDADAFILNNQTLIKLIDKQKSIVAPLLHSGHLYSNFWGGMDSNFYYKRTNEYLEIVNRKRRGCFSVPMIHSAVLINLRLKTLPGFNESGPGETKHSSAGRGIPEDDIIRFALNANSLGIPMYICNDIEYGVVLSPLGDEGNLRQDQIQLHNLRIEAAAYWSPAMEVSLELEEWAQSDPLPTSLGFDEIYLINLKRRPDRLNKMENVLKILGIEFKLMHAVDGKELNTSTLDAMGIQPMPEYKDPYSQRVMTFGEIGCFLSHFNVWQDMLRNHHKTALVLEDDIRFEPYFVHQLQQVFQEAGNVKLDWDLIYLGRKRPSNEQEPFAPGSSLLVELGYSYWTLGYAITSRGARKVIQAKPLQKLLPIDEFLPIMFNRHSNQEWKNHFPERNLKAFSAEPLLLYPTHYTGEIGYISDTEASLILNLNSSQTKRSTTKEEL